jgi:hypothetical protein
VSGPSSETLHRLGRRTASPARLWRGRCSPVSGLVPGQSRRCHPIGFGTSSPPGSSSLGSSGPGAGQKDFTGAAVATPDRLMWPASCLDLNLLPITPLPESEKIKKTILDTPAMRSGVPPALTDWAKILQDPPPLCRHCLRPKACGPGKSLHQRKSPRRIARNPAKSRNCTGSEGAGARRRNRPSD